MTILIKDAVWRTEANAKYRFWRWYFYRDMQQGPVLGLYLQSVDIMLCLFFILWWKIKKRGIGFCQIFFAQLFTPPFRLRPCSLPAPPAAPWFWEIDCAAKRRAYYPLIVSREGPLWERACSVLECSTTNQIPRTILPVYDVYNN